MHDDEDADDSKGQIFYSDINLEADRADYALPRGTPALQDGDVEYELESPGASRRRLLVYGLGLGTLGIVSAFYGGVVAGATREGADKSPHGSKPRQSFDKDAQWLVRGARAAADGPLDQLVGSYGSYIMVVEEYGRDDPILWDGVERLGRFAIVERRQKGVDIAKRLKTAFQHITPPPQLRSLRLELEDLIWRWERRK